MSSDPIFPEFVLALPGPRADNHFHHKDGEQEEAVEPEQQLITEILFDSKDLFKYLQGINGSKKSDESRLTDMIRRYTKSTTPSHIFALQYVPGTVIMAKGTTGDYAAVLIQGKVRVFDDPVVKLPSGAGCWDRPLLRQLENVYRRCEQDLKNQPKPGRVGRLVGRLYHRLPWLPLALIRLTGVRAWVGRLVGRLYHRFPWLPLALTRRTAGTAGPDSAPPIEGKAATGKQEVPPATPPTSLERHVGRLVAQHFSWFKLTDQSLDTLRNKNLPDVVLSRLKPLKEKELQRTDFESELARLLVSDEMDKFLNLILDHAYFSAPVPRTERTISERTRPTSIESIASDREAHELEPMWAIRDGMLLPISKRLIGMMGALYHRPRAVTIQAEDDDGKACQLIHISRKALDEMFDDGDSGSGKEYRTNHLKEFIAKALSGVLKSNKLFRDRVFHTDIHDWPRLIQFLGRGSPPAGSDPAIRRSVQAVLPDIAKTYATGSRSPGEPTAADKDCIVDALNRLLENPDFPRECLLRTARLKTSIKASIWLLVRQFSSIMRSLAAPSSGGSVQFPAPHQEGELRTEAIGLRDRYPDPQPAWFKLTDQSLDTLRNKNLPEGVLSKLEPLKDKELQRADLESELARLLSADEMDKFLNLILKHAHQPTPPRTPSEQVRLNFLLLDAGCPGCVDPGPIQWPLFPEQFPAFAKELVEEYEKIQPTLSGHRAAFEPWIVDKNDGSFLKEGDLADALYLVMSGMVRVTRRLPGGEAVMAHVQGGDFFGESAGLLQEPDSAPPRRLASVAALCKTALLPIPRGLLLHLHTLPKYAWFTQRLTGQRAQIVIQNISYDAGFRLPPIDPPPAIVDKLVLTRNLLLIDMDKCTRCDQCVQACAAAHEGVPRFHRANPELRFGKWEVAGACLHCLDAPCVEECPAAAITFLEDGAVQIHRNRCIDCKKCVAACPFHVIDKTKPLSKEDAPKANKLVATKCDLCLTDDHDPPCVAACPYDAAQRVNPADETVFGGLLGRAISPAPR